MTVKMDLTGVKELQAAYDAQGNTPLTETLVSSHVNGKKVEAGPALQKAANTALLSSIENDILTSFPLRNKVAYFKETVHAYLESLGQAPKPITTRDISAILGYLISDLEEIPVDGLTGFPLEQEGGSTSGLSKDAKEILHTLKHSGMSSQDKASNVNAAVASGTISFEEGENILAQLNANSLSRDPLSPLSESLRQSVQNHTDDFPDPALRNLLLQKLTVRPGGNPLLTKLAQASQKEHQNILLNEYRSLANKQMFHDMTLKAMPTLTEEVRAELCERACTQYEDQEQLKAFTTLLNTGKAKAEQKEMNDPAVLSQYKTQCLTDANTGMQKIQSTQPVSPNIASVKVDSAGPTSHQVAPGSTFRQNDSTCFMVSVANALASTKEGAAYLGNWVGTHPLVQPNPHFSPFENTVGALYQQSDPDWTLGSIGVGPDAAGSLGLDNTKNSVILAPPAMSAWQHRDLWVNTSERLSQGEMAILYTDSPKHYRAIVGTWGDPKGEPGKDFGFIVRDSLSQSDQRVTIGSLMSHPTMFSNNQMLQTSPTQISFFKLPTEAEPR